MNSNVLAGGIKPDGYNLTVLEGLPLFIIPRKVAADVTFDVASTQIAVRGVTVAETRGATKIVVFVDKEMAGLAAIAFFAFDVTFAVAFSRSLVTLGRVVDASLRHALTTVTARVVKVPIIGSTFVAFFTSDSRLAFALTVRCTLGLFRS